MRNIIIDTFDAVKKDLNQLKRKNCFEFLGYDFLIDSEFRVWLLEVNNNPYLGVPNKQIKSLLPKMTTDMINIIF